MTVFPLFVIIPFLFWLKLCRKETKNQTKIPSPVKPFNPLKPTHDFYYSDSDSADSFNSEDLILPNQSMPEFNAKDFEDKSKE